MPDCHTPALPGNPISYLSRVPGAVFSAMALHSERFLHDPRVTEARRLVLEALAEHQGGLAGILPPDAALSPAARETMGEFGRLRGSELYFPFLGSGFGRGALVELSDGSVKYDFISGIGVHMLGHGHPSVVGAAFDGAVRDTVMQGNLQQHEETIGFLELLQKAATESGAGLDHIYLTTSGAMANENALKILFQKKSPADRLLAFDGCFAGRTLALSQVTDKAAYRQGLPNTLGVDYIPFFDYRDPKGSESRALTALDRITARYPGRHAGMILELIQGEGGFYPGESGFFRALMSSLRNKGIPILVDEIQTAGRTSRLFAFQHFGLDEFVDVVTVGKLTQVCATLYKKEFKPGPGLISQTFTGSTVAFHAGRAILCELLGGGYFGPAGRIQKLHEHMVRRLSEIGSRHPGQLEGPFGVGAMIAFSVLDGSEERTKEFVKRLFDAGVIAFTSGRSPLRVRFLLPVGAVTEDDLDKAAVILESVLVGMKNA